MNIPLITIKQFSEIFQKNKNNSTWLIPQYLHDKHKLKEKFQSNDYKLNNS